MDDSSTKTIEADEVDLLNDFFLFRTYKSKTPFLYIRANTIREIQKIEIPEQR